MRNETGAVVGRRALIGDTINDAFAVSHRAHASVVGVTPHFAARAPEVPVVGQGRQVLL